MTIDCLDFKTKCHTNNHKNLKHKPFFSARQQEAATAPQGNSSNSYTSAGNRPLLPARKGHAAGPATLRSIDIRSPHPVTQTLNSCPGTEQELRKGASALLPAFSQDLTFGGRFLGPANAPLPSPRRTLELLSPLFACLLPRTERTNFFVLCHNHCTD